MRLAVDLGGTQLRVAAVSDEMELSRLLVIPTPAQEGPAAVAEAICTLVQQVDGWERAEAVGIGIPGGVADHGRRLTLCSNLPGMDSFPLKDTLEARLKQPVTLLNDGDAACLGESLLGSGRGYESCCYVTVSTGIGGGYCAGGKLLQGIHGAAAEFGSMIIKPGGTRSGELPTGAAESLISGTALTLRARQATGQAIAHAGEVFAGAEENPALRALTDEFMDGLAILLSNLACLFDPACFVLGGGLMKSRALFWDVLCSRYRTYVGEVYADTPLLLARLQEPGLLGAALAR